MWELAAEEVQAGGGLVLRNHEVRGIHTAGASVAGVDAADVVTGRVRRFEADYVGFDIPDEFVVGYGLDFGNRYRNLPDVCVLKSHVLAGRQEGHP